MSPFTFNGSIVFDLTTVLILALVTTLVLLLWIYIKRTRNNRLLVVLEIGNQKTYVRVRCLQLHGTLYTYKFNADAYIDTLSITPFSPILSITWPSFQISYVLEGVTHRFPDKVRMNLIEAYNLRHILRDGAFYCLCLLKYNSNFRFVDFESSTEPSVNAVFLGEQQTDEQPEARVQIVASVPQQLQFYPSLLRLTTAD